MTNFSAQVDKWARKSQNRLDAVVRDASQSVVTQVTKPKGSGGNMPIITGFLRTSLKASKSVFPRIEPNAKPVPDGSYGQIDPSITLSISTMKAGDKLYLGFTAVYARVQEMRNGFVRLTAQNWQQTVRQSVARIKRRVTR